MRTCHKIEIPLTPAQKDTIEWAVGGAEDYWPTQDFLEGREWSESKAPILRENSVEIPCSDLQSDILDDLVYRVETQLEEMVGREFGFVGDRLEPKGLQAYRVQRATTEKLKAAQKELGGD